MVTCARPAPCHPRPHTDCVSPVPPRPSAVPDTHPPWLTYCPSVLPALLAVLLCCRPCLGSLISWCQPVQWAWDAALQPLLEASSTSSLPGLPEPDLEGWVGVCCSFWVEGPVKGLMGGHPGSDWIVACGLQGPMPFCHRAECSSDTAALSCRRFYSFSIGVNSLPASCYLSPAPLCLVIICSFACLMSIYLTFSIVCLQLLALGV